MVVAPERRAVEAGARVLIHGGAAFDAAVTCAFVQGALSPHSCGIGGYAVTVDPVTGELAGGADTGAGGMAMEIKDDGVATVSG
jgi:gamma-glutamyltranspeptidase/glutathione hydrolase